MRFLLAAWRRLCAALRPVSAEERFLGGAVDLVDLERRLRLIHTRCYGSALRPPL